MLSRQPDNRDSALAQTLAECGQILCLAQNTLSGHRTFQLYFHFKKKNRKIAASQPADELLFGADFAEKCKNIKSFENTAKELQAPSTSKNLSGPAFKSHWKPIKNIFIMSGRKITDNKFKLDKWLSNTI
jgi:hypothetical protein